MYAPHDHAQYRRHRVLSVACSGFSTVVDIKGDVAASYVVYLYQLRYGTLESSTGTFL